MNPYSSELEQSMKCLYKSLNECSRRRYASVEAEKLGCGGKQYIVGLFKCSSNTLAKGRSELASRLEGIELGRIRKKGGGAKQKKKVPVISETFLDVVSEHTAGDPCEENSRWTYLHQQEIADMMKEKGANISRTVVRQLLKDHGFVKRKSQKMKAVGKSPENRNEQFENIQKLKELHQQQGDAVISMDTKKRANRRVFTA